MPRGGAPRRFPLVPRTGGGMGGAAGPLLCRSVFACFPFLPRWAAFVFAAGRFFLQRFLQGGGTSEPGEGAALDVP